MTQDRAPRIAALNDTFRASGFGVTLTQGVQALDDVAGLVDTVRAFDTFTGDNDPYGEHDFGPLTFEGQKIFWKIDYYDQALQYGEDPLSPTCRRVLTIMLASEH